MEDPLHTLAGVADREAGEMPATRRPNRALAMLVYERTVLRQEESGVMEVEGPAAIGLPIEELVAIAALLPLSAAQLEGLANDRTGDRRQPCAREVDLQDQLRPPPPLGVFDPPLDEVGPGAGQVRGEFVRVPLELPHLPTVAGSADSLPTGSRDSGSESWATSTAGTVTSPVSPLSNRTKAPTGIR